MPAVAMYGAIKPINAARKHLKLLLLNAICPNQNTGINASKIGANKELADNISIHSILCHGAINFSD
jgi:hypothetical protein